MMTMRRKARKSAWYVSLGILSVIFFTYCSGSRRSGISTPDAVRSSNALKNARVGPQADSSYFVSTAQIIDPAGKTVTFPGRPVDLCYNRDETVLAVKNLNSLIFFNVSEKKIIQTLKLPQGGNTFVGLVWSGRGKDEKIWTTDTRGFIRSAIKNNNSLFDWKDEFNLPEFRNEDKGGLDPGGLTVIDKKGSYPGGFAIDETKGIIYIALNRNNSLCIMNMNTGEIEKEILVGIAPYSVTIKGNKAYVSNLGGRVPRAGDKTALTSGSPIVVDSITGVASSGTVSVIDLTSHKVVREIPVDLHPCAMVLTPDGLNLYVSNANSDVISVVDTELDKVVKRLGTRPLEKLPLGSSPNALAISPDGNKLYICNGGNNAIAVLNLKTDSLTGLIPTGWYPGAILLNRSGSDLVVANIKGIGGRAKKPEKKGFTSHDHMGSVSFIQIPADDLLRTYTAKAMVNMQLQKIESAMTPASGKNRKVPVPIREGETSVFKHVLYIIKENRTYDQVLGDLPQGNGDSSLCLFGRDVSPNTHALAEQFVLLDNTYCNGVNSADGHQWTNEGIATENIEKSYGGFVRSYPCCAGEDPLAYSSAGFIWNKVLEKKLTFRDYGEFVDAKIEPADMKWTDHYNDFINKTNKAKILATTELSTLAPYLCPTFIGFPETVPDVYRANEFIKELHEFERNDNLPNFMIMLLPNDHTAGTQENYPTPRAMVADNDLALGRIVEAVSKSKFWKETAIFVIEDDAQAGLDHVDGRRTVSLCISPYTKRGSVVSTMYNQNSILRTIQLILGLTPMTQFDLLATPMTDCFANKPNFTPYTAIPNKIPLNEMNPNISTLKGKQSYWAKKSMEIPLMDVDLSDGKILSRILWYSVKGYDSFYPEQFHKTPMDIF